MTFVIFLVSMLGITVATHALADDAEAVSRSAITGVDVIDVQSGAVLENRTILIESERIVDVVETDGGASPAGFEPIDGTGLYAIPGLWDMHVHMINDTNTLVPWDMHVPDSTQADQREIYMPLYVAFGVTGAREMSGGLKSIELRVRVESGELRGPHLHIGSPLLEGPYPIWPDSPVIAIEGPEHAREVVSELHAQGFDFLKPYSFLSLESYRALHERARELGMEVSGEIPLRVSLWEAVELGQRSVEHLTGAELASSTREAELRADYVRRIAAIDEDTTEDERVAIWNDSEWQTADSIDPARQEALFAYLAAHGTWVCPTLIIQKMISYSEAPGIATNPLYRYLDPWSRDPVGAADEFDPERRLRALYDHRFAVIDDLHRAGVGILAGTDTPAGFTLHWELELFVESGLTPLQALRTATINPARYLDRERDHGSIEPGKFADLVLLRENPLDDIRNTMEIECVVLRGSVLDRAELDRMLQQIEQDAEHWPE